VIYPTLDTILWATRGGVIHPALKTTFWTTRGEDDPSKIEHIIVGQNMEEREQGGK
jgi:hypothetical protein